MGPWCCVQILSASELPSASITVNPAPSSSALQSLTIESSSSTTKIVGELFDDDVLC